MLEGCCVNLDAFHATKIFLDENGFLYDTPRGSKSRPECAVMRDSWRAYLSGVKILGITSKPETGKQAGHPVGDARQLKAVKTW